MIDALQQRTPRENHLLVNAKQDMGHLIFHRNNHSDGEVIVYVDKVGDLEWECDDHAECKLGPLKGVLGKVQNGVAELEPIAHHWPSDLKLITKRVLGEAIARVVQGDADGAEAALKHAQRFVRNKSQQVSRYWTLRACLASGGIAAFVGTVQIALRPWFETALNRTPYLLSLCFWAGCIGALLFVILKIGGERKVDSTAERHLHYYEGCARIAAGGIAGVFVGAMIKLGLVLPVFTQTGMESLAMCTGALIAGASERFAAGIMTSVENSNTNQKETTNEHN